ncbi:hypothetical protein EDD86DRAFT_220340 [Gorgonomyces haynaldii]|nr:hypothetical protein EDD86DRAFT_220340 [Gorgonomyces haynaldii]
MLVADNRLNNYYNDELHSLAMQHPPDLAFHLFQILSDSKFGADSIIDLALMAKNRRIVDALSDEVFGYERIESVLWDAWRYGYIDYVRELLHDPRCEEQHLNSVVTSSFTEMTLQLIQSVMEGREFSQFDFLEPFHSSLERGYPDIARYLLPHVHVNKEGYIALYWMCIYGQFDLFREILEDDRLNYPGRVDLLKKSDMEIFEHLLKDENFKKARNSADKMDLGPYSVSSAQVVELLVKYGIDPARLLYDAIKQDAIDVIHHLLKKEDLVFTYFHHGFIYCVINQESLAVLEMLLDDPRISFESIHKSLSSMVDGDYWTVVRCILLIRNWNSRRM